MEDENQNLTTVDILLPQYSTSCALGRIESQTKKDLL
jgi:hypothetical protein